MMMNGLDIGISLEVKVTRYYILIYKRANFILISPPHHVMLSQYLLKLKKLPETNKQENIENNWIKKIILMPTKGFVFFFFFLNRLKNISNFFIC